jgi:hypothetical protein
MFISKRISLAGILATLSFALSSGATLGTNAAYACHAGICGGHTTTLVAH